MRHFALLLIIVMALSACGELAVGPVDHECHTDPLKSQGSGCDASPDN